MDVSGCTFKESAELPVVVVVLSVRAGENEIRANETAFKDQVCLLRFTLNIRIYSEFLLIHYNVYVKEKCG